MLENTSFKEADKYPATAFFISSVRVLSVKPFFSYLYLQWPGLSFFLFLTLESESNLLLIKVKENGFDQTLVYRRTGRLPHFILCFWPVQPSFSQFLIIRGNFLTVLR